MKKQKTGYFVLIKSMLGVAGRKIPFFFLLLVLCEITTGVVQGSSVWFKQQMFDQARAVAEGEAFSGVGAAAAALCIFFILQLLMNAVNAVFENSFQLRLEQAAGEELNRKAARIDPICYEDPRTSINAGRAIEARVGRYR